MWVVQSTVCNKSLLIHIDTSWNTVMGMFSNPSRTDQLDSCQLHLCTPEYLLLSSTDRKELPHFTVLIHLLLYHTGSGPIYACAMHWYNLKLIMELARR